MVPKDNMSKWQKASVEITDLRFKLGNILDEKFTQEEKESKKYEQLLETVDVLFDHVLGEYREKIEENKRRELVNQIIKYKNKSKFFSLRTCIIGTLAIVITELSKWFILLIMGL